MLQIGYGASGRMITARTAGGWAIKVRRRHLWPAAQAVAFLIFATYRIWVASATTPAVWNDSEAYLAVSRHSLHSTALWTGPRAPLVPLFLKLTGGYSGYGIAQAVVGTLAWGVLAWTASTLVASGWRRVAMTVGVLGLATAPLVVQWDWSVLSESPSLSALAVLLAYALWLARRFTWVRLGGLTAAAAVYVGLRDADIWDVGLIGFVLLVVGGASTIRGGAMEAERFVESIRSTVRRRWVRTRVPITAGAALFGVALLAGIGANASHRNVLNIEEAFSVRVFPYPDRVAWFESRGMPEGQSIDTLAHETPPPLPGNAPKVAPNLNDPSWRPLKTWFAQESLTTYATFLVTHPGYVVTAPFQTPPLTYNNASGDLAFYIPVNHLVLKPFGTAFTPDKVVVIVLAVCALLIASARGVLRRREWILMAAFAVFGLIAMLLAWHGEGQEVTRHMVEGDVEVRLGVLLALLVGVLGEREPTVDDSPEAASERDELPDRPKQTLTPSAATATQGTTAPGRHRAGHG